jgi:hypothetical protein
MDDYYDLHDYQEDISDILDGVPGPRHSLRPGQDPIYGGLYDQFETPDDIPAWEEENERELDTNWEGWWESVLWGEHQANR